MDESHEERHSVVTMSPPVKPYNLSKVPFVELADGRLQGVVSSGSDPARVYVSSIAAGSHDYSCSTNNNRTCGGLGGYRGMCKHIDSLVTAAVHQYGFARVAAYLKPPSDPASYNDDKFKLLAELGGSLVDDNPMAEVFSRFLNHLTYLEVPATTEPIPELQWFPATGER